MKPRKNTSDAKASNEAKSHSEKFRTSREILDRIRWDPSLDENAFTILYPDRLEGVRKIPFPEFIKKPDLVLHRIQQICIGDFVVWDRVERIDRICGSGKTPQKEHTLVLEALARWEQMKSAPTTLTLVGSKSSNELSLTPAYCYDYLSGKWISPENVSSSFTLPSTLVMLTYNVLMDWKSTGELLEEKGRFPALFKIFQENEADILAIQEVTPDFLQKLLQQDWIRTHYFVSENTDAKNVSPYGQILLSRYPFQFGHYTFSAHKKALLAMFSSQPFPIFLANVHLMSDRASNAKVQRSRQLQKILELLTQLETSHLSKGRESLRFILGDFNAKEDTLRLQLEPLKYQDVWKTLYPEDNGYTFDPVLNGIAAMNSLSGQPARLDQVWYSSSEVVSCDPIEMTRLGTEPLNEKFSATEFLFPSDHFGLCALFQLNLSSQNDRLTEKFQGSMLKKDYTVKSALALIPPESCWPLIQCIRKNYDPSYTRWMPHINLIYPFLPEDFFEQIAPQIQDILSHFAPFSITFRHFRFFRHRQSTTIWLEPETDPPEILLNLEAKLQQCFASFAPDSQARPFTPHLTVARLENEDHSESEIEQYLLEWQKSWQAISFVVQEISLISRQKETPFSIKKSFSFSSPLSTQKTTKTLLTQLEQILRKNAPSLFPEASFALYQVGSTRLGNTSNSSDIDFLCIGPAQVSRETFFSTFVNWLESSELFLQSSRTILDAIVPILKLSIDGQKIDIQYVALPDLPKHPTLKDIQAIDLSLLPRCDQYALASLLDAEALFTHIQNYGGTTRFLETRALLKSWILARDIHSNAFGFPGSFAWTLLLARVLCEAPLTAEPQALFTHLLHFLVQHHFSQIVTYNQKIPPSFSTHPSDTLLLILTPTPPYRNTTRGIIPSTQKILQQEVKRAWDLTQNNAWTASEIFAPLQPLEAHPYFLVLQIEASSAESLEQGTGWLEGHILHLFLEIEKQLSSSLTPQIRPYSSRYRSTIPHSYFWIAGLFNENGAWLQEKLSPLFQYFLQQWKEEQPVSETLRFFVLDSKSIQTQFPWAEHKKLDKLS